VLVHSQPDRTLDDYAQITRVAPGTDLVSPTLPVREAVDDFFKDAPDTTL